MALQQSADNYRGYRNAGMRLSEDLLGSLKFHRTDKLFDTIRSIHKFDKAHTVMLVEKGLIPKDAGKLILESLRGTEGDDGKARLESDGGKHSGEQFLIRKHGEDVGGWINTGRSSGDLGQIGRFLTIRDHLLEILPSLLEFRRSLLDLAEKFDDVVIPGQTFLQHGQPTTLGHWFSMWASVFERNFSRFCEIYSRANRSPAGAAIFTGTDFEIDRTRVAELLGFEEPIPHTMDAIFSQDVLIETVSQVALFWSDFGRLAEDIELWLSTEYSYIDFPDRFCDTSSIMPQKRNPSLPQQIKSQVAKAIGNVTTGFIAERGSSGQPQNARYETERILWESFGSIRTLLNDAGMMLESLVPNAEYLLEQAANHWSTATDLASLIVREKCLSWRTAHQIVAIVVRLADERGVSPAHADRDLVDEAANLYFDQPIGLSNESIREALDPVKSVARRKLCGGPGKAAHAITCQRLLNQIENDSVEFEMMLTKAQSGAEELERAIDQITS